MSRFIIFGVTSAFGAVALADEPRFDVEVMAVLSRAGCNQGACHGNQYGKGGFKLSLRGENPSWDYQALTRHALGRRVNPLLPDESLILRKATATLPHEGGQRFSNRSPEYQILHQWIAQGAGRRPPARRLIRLSVEPASVLAHEPVASVALRVQALWSDGQQTDVTRLTAFEVVHPEKAVVDPDGTVHRRQFGETTVMVRFLDQQTAVPVTWVQARPDFVWSPPAEKNVIDRHIFAKLRTLQIHPSPLCDDATFLRRVYLDLIGTLPTPAAVRQFLRDPRPDKRERVVDELLHRPEFASYWALMWADLLRVEEKSLDRKGVAVFHDWLRRQIAADRPLNAMVHDLLMGRGSTYVHGPANYYRALRDPAGRAEAAAQVFLGIRLQCARCHNHPFDRWTMDDYYGIAAFFARVQYRVVENRRQDNLDTHEFIGEQIVWLDRVSEVKDPRTNQVVPPRLPDEALPLLPHEDRLAAWAEWVTSPTNPYFARVQVNRVWARLMGRGLVDPVDDFRSTNPPPHPELLNELACDFVTNGFHLKHLIRQVTSSATYQLRSEPNQTNAEDDLNYSHASIRRLTAEVLLDAVADALAVPVKHEGQPLGRRAIELPGVMADPSGKQRTFPEQFMKTFGKPERLLTCECERRDEVSIPQALQMFNGEIVNRLLRSPNNRLSRLLAEHSDMSTLIDELWLATVSRFPSAVERSAAEAHLLSTKDRRAALEDLAWALLNSKEFQLRR